MTTKKALFGIVNLAVVGLILLWLPGRWSRTQSAQAQSIPTLTISGPATCQQGQTCNYAAGGGAEPYTFTLVSGSVGSVTSGGVYTAPAHVVPKQVINGCQGLPNNSIFNTRIDALPLHPSSAIWLSNTDPGHIFYTAAQRIHGSTVLSTSPSSSMSFAYTPQANGPFIFVPFPYTVAESGTDIPGGVIGTGRDNHYITTYRDNCKQQEIYQLYQSNIFVGNPGGNSQSGIIYDLTNFVHPGYGTDAAGTYMSPLLVHLDEMLAAEAGNLDAIQHAVRVDEDTASIDASVGIWPAQNPGGSPSCQGGPSWPVSANGTTTITGSGFNINWLAGTPVTIKGSSYTVASVNSVSSITLNQSVEAGSYTMSLSHTACAPYGARFRLKSSYVWPGFDGLCSTKACQNVVNALLRSQQRYGLVLADVGSIGEIDIDGGQYPSADIGNALREIASKLNLGKDSFEVVDEGVLNTRQGGGEGGDQKWHEAKLNNGLITPDDASVIKVTDSGGSVGYFSVALQGVAIGVPNPIEVVMAGASPIQFSPWITGTLNTGYSCSLSPSGGANGTITSQCVYTPPPTSGIKTRTDTTVTITAAADQKVTKTFHITILPVAADGNLYISLGKSAYADTYTDNNGIVWWSDMPPGQPFALFPDNGIGGGGGSWSGANSAEAPGIYTQGALGAGNDMHFPIWVPNGTVTGTVYMANFSATANRQGFSFDCNGNRLIDVSDTYTYTGSKGPYAAAPLTCSPAVTNGKLHMVLRWQGVNLQADPCCTLPVYHAGLDAVWAAGLVVSPRGARPPRVPLPPRR